MIPIVPTSNCLAFTFLPLDSSAYDDGVDSPSLISNLSHLKVYINITLANCSKAHISNIFQASFFSCISFNYMLFVCIRFNLILFWADNRSNGCGPYKETICPDICNVELLSWRSKLFKFKIEWLISYIK